ncbi:MAG: tyrosine-type recombinase/integrase [Bacteroidetes bacterium]|nr:tyrosine-type recombinase/integrase [Bacteroidota bacterium]
MEYTIGEQVSTHTARRTFATIMFNLGCPVRSIMKITGHIQLETFFSYIKLNSDDNEQMITIK